MEAHELYQPVIAAYVPLHTRSRDDEFLSPREAVQRILRLWLVSMTLSAAALAVLSFFIYYRPATEHFAVSGLLLISSLAALLSILFLTWRRTARLAGAMISDLDRVTTSEQETEVALKTLEIEYRDVFKGHPIPLWIFDLRSLRIIAVNEAAITSYGYSRMEFLRMTIKDLRMGSEIPALEDYLSTARPLQADAGVWQHRKKDGTVIDVEIVSHELDWRGRKVRLVSAADVTQRVTAERQLAALNSSLEARVRERTQKVRRYARKLRERGRELAIVNRDLEMFSYSASHDLRTPLFVVNVFATMLMEDFSDELPTAAKEHVLKIHMAAQNMASLVDDLMKLAKVSKHIVKRQTVNLSEVAASLVTLLQSKDSSRNVTVDIQDSMLVDADPGLLGIALENLLGNAWKYTAYAPQARIRLGIESQDDETVIFVRDNGAGFDMQHSDGLFKPFHRLHGEDKFEGTGIGLAIVQRVVALHGGRVWAEGEVDRGATFFFALPAAGCAGRQAQPMAALADATVP